ncbi:TPA: hydrogenase expression/formation protein HypE, partial [candidate division CPR2 bacterium]|nr:hydrogenase expression/formation protein HypE [candidate division CPR2 bacterium]
GIEIEEQRVPIKKEVASVCNLLGFDPLYLANEGKLVAIISPDDKLPKEMIVIGRVTGEHEKVVLKNQLGGKRIIDIPDGEILPRIC